MRAVKSSEPENREPEIVLKVSPDATAKGCVRFEITKSEQIDDKIVVQRIEISMTGEEAGLLIAGLSAARAPSALEYFRAKYPDVKADLAQLTGEERAALELGVCPTCGAMNERWCCSDPPRDREGE